MAMELASHACCLVLTARRAERLAVVAVTIGPAALAWFMSMRDDAAVDALMGCLPEEFRQVDVLVNNAGYDVGGKRLFAAGAADDWTDIIDTNLRAVLCVTRAVLPGIRQRRKGDVVNMGSTYGIKSYANIAAYGASKAALHMLSDNLWTELSGSGVRVIEVQPGPLLIGFAEGRMRGDQMSDNMPLGPTDVADTVVFALTRPPHVTLEQIGVQPSSKY